MSDLHEAVLAWYDSHARQLPWREPTATPWGVLVSELMLQQTPVARVLPVYERWMEVWPTPAALADAAAGEAIRAWGRLGYPRRALRLHQAARTIVEQHAGEVPDDLEALRALPGVGEYTAAAVASFAFAQRHAVLDTNVRRVLGRLHHGVALPPRTLTRAEREAAQGLLPEEPARAADWAVAVMELGALVCSASAPACSACPVRERCAWRLAGSPPDQGPARTAQRYAGTDRQCRGRLLAVLRDAPGPVHRTRLDAAWDRPEQRERCLAGLVADGLVARPSADTWVLP